jgi:excinuclease ABC subunit C
LLKLQQDLQLKTIPLHIECFDNSNLQGTIRSSMVYFRNGVAPEKITGITTLKRTGS